MLFLLLVEKMKYQSYNIKARVVYELKIKVKFEKVIKWFVHFLLKKGNFLSKT